MSHSSSPQHIYLPHIRMPSQHQKIQQNLFLAFILVKIMFVGLGLSIVMILNFIYIKVHIIVCINVTFGRQNGVDLTILRQVAV